jgi:hypothetical protein
MEAKACYRCHEVKLLTDYYKRRDKTTGVCKACMESRICERRATMTPEQNKERLQKRNLANQKYRENNKGRIKKDSQKWPSQQAAYRRNNPHRKAMRKEHRINNLDVAREKKRAYYQRRKDAYLTYQSMWLKQRVDDLSLEYVNVLLGGSKLNKLPLELLEAKRVQVQIRRELMRINRNQELTKEERV